MFDKWFGFLSSSSKNFFTKERVEIKHKITFEEKENENENTKEIKGKESNTFGIDEARNYVKENGYQEKNKISVVFDRDSWTAFIVNDEALNKERKKEIEEEIKSRIDIYNSNCLQMWKTPSKEPVKFVYKEKANSDAYDETPLKISLRDNENDDKTNILKNALENPISEEALEFAKFNK